MIPSRIKQTIEKSDAINGNIDAHIYGQDWPNYTRTIFMKIAKIINKNVTQRVITKACLVKDCLLIGENEIEKILFKGGHTSIDNFISSLKELPPHRTHNWISGKTLQSYWNGANAKDKKLNVLLTYLDIDQREWDEWKNSDLTPIYRNKVTDSKQEHSNYLLKKYYLGSYYRYYQKADNSNVVIKTPFKIREDSSGNVIAESKTVGHRYKSFSIEISDGAMYIDCKNVDWDEREHHIFNIGIATSPEVLIGVSSSLNNRKQAISKRNVIIRQKTAVDYERTGAIELPYDMQFEEKCDDSIAVDFFKKRKNNLIITSLYYSLNELEILNHHPILE
jgi:hypothetical protein